MDALQLSQLAANYAAVGSFAAAVVAAVLAAVTYGSTFGVFKKKLDT